MRKKVPENRAASYQDRPALLRQCFFVQSMPQFIKECQENADTFWDEDGTARISQLRLLMTAT
ncbi:hypothetical protein QWY16_08870 [Planococcus shenhongbingii]|uniref:Uncharacterized protein n=1 Tax=Planococcus shenhongbingii TaxID=3058398 RepID=A0ABT8NCT0_9BACL|nr:MULTISPECIES: hypothetical protein [unclassified Planococcus (in: firmicutes)]MDN7245679.1 hypothetical protein [Planococcus sp. N017]WKA60203.1 hypothetical protein QWY16_08870 [Planococcus sp. N016]